MSTNFALSLSFEGIQLLHRVTGGWRLVGEADVEADDLDAQLADLRKKALALEPGGIASKLVIPLDQIKYMALDTTQTSDEDIHAALDGTTPYDLDELVIDCERRGGRTHIAAVARETLDEAEAFARAHQFNPVCFVAIPEPFTFQSEVFFGPTRTMSDVLGMGATVDRDILPIMIVGTRVKSRLLIFDIPEEELPPTEENDLAALLAPHLEEPERPEEQAKAEPESVATPEKDVSEETPPIVEVAHEPADEPALEDAPDDETDAPEVVPETDKAETPENTPEPAEAADAEEDASTEETDPVDTPTATDDVAAEPEQDETPEIETVDAAQVDTEAVDEPTDQEDAEYETPQKEPAVMVEPAEAQEDTPPTAAEPEQPELFPTATPPQAEPAKPVAKAPPPKTTPVFAIPLDPIIEEYHTARPKYKRRARRRIVGTTQVAPAATPGMPSAADIAAIPSAPAAPRRVQPTQPQTGVSKKVLVGTALAASFVLAGLLAWMQFSGADSDGADGVNPTAPAAQADTADTAAAIPVAAPPATNNEAALSKAPVVTLLDTIPQTAPLPLTHSVAPPAPVPATRKSAAPVLASAADADLVLPPQSPMPAPPPEDTTAQASVGAPVLRGQVLSPDEAARIYAATGVWQRAPRIVSIPDTTDNTAAAWPDPDSAPDAVGQPIVPDAGALEPELSFVAPADPPPPDASFRLDDDGFVAATPEGTVTPEGAVVFAGLPEDVTLRRRPTLTQDDLDRMALLAPAPEGVVVIAGSPEVIPPLRPADAALPDTAQPAETDDASTLGGVGLAGLIPGETDEAADETVEAALGSTVPTGPRPSTRPSDLVPLVREDLPTNPDITSVIAGIAEEDAAAAASAFVDPTASAVAQSNRPRTRPGNFDRIVAAAQPRPAPQPAPTQTTATAPRAPQSTASVAPPPQRQTGPVPGGVARAATQEDAIRLREMNLIGVYGRPNARRALVRLSSGRYVRVEIGSSLDGGQVTAIGDNALNYVKRGRTYALQVPEG